MRLHAAEKDNAVINIVVYADLAVLEDFVQSSLAGLCCSSESIGHDRNSQSL